MAISEIGGMLWPVWPRKFISKICSLFFFPLVKFQVGNGARLGFWEDSWTEEHPLYNFPCLYHLSTLHYARVSDFMVREGHLLSWNLNFRRNLQDRLVEWDRVCRPKEEFGSWEFGV